MKLKFDLDLKLGDLTSGIKAGLKAAAGSTAGMTKEKARTIASNRLKRGLKHWNKGLSLDNVGDGVYVVSIKGKLANMMEDGFTGPELKDLLLSGQRAAHNRAQGKDYVDVPIGLDADDLTLVKKGDAEIKMSQFRDADEMLRQVTISDYKQKKIRTQNAVVNRSKVEDVIKYRTAEGGKGIKTAFMTIRRVSPKSKPWKGWKGAKVLESSDLDQYIEKAFETSLKRII